MKRAPNFKKRNFSASKGQLGAPVQICFLSFSDQIICHDLSKWGISPGHIKCLD